MIVLSVILIYAGVIGYFILGFDKLKITSEIMNNEELVKPLTSFSIVVPFRNEAENLPGLLHSLAKLDYPKDCFEILLIDDESTDDSRRFIAAFKEKNPTIILEIYNNERLTTAPKKDAITVAINNVKFEWIITTDADCLVQGSWLNCFHEFITTNQVSLVAGPVIYTTSNSFLDQYQFLDFLSLQGITMGSFGHQKGLFCNGANLAYTKTLFKAINGFTNNNTIASGDDVFMLENAQAQFPEKVGYLKNRLAIVETFPENTWKNLIAQRTRWAKKTSKQNNLFTKLLGLIVFFTNIIVVLLPLLIGGQSIPIWTGISALVLKVLIDYLLLQKTGRFFSQRISVVQVFIHFYVYAIVSTWVVLRSPFISYSWKGRSHRH